MRLSRLFFAFALAATVAVKASAAPLSLTLVHVNDTHSYAAGSDARALPCYDDTHCRGGHARLAAFIEQQKASGDNVLALDAGDSWQGTLFFDAADPSFSVALERLMPYEALTLGNHEFDLGCEAAARYVNALDKPVLAANLAPEPDCPLSHAALKPYRLFSFGRETVAVIGLANDEVREISKACPHTHFLDRQAALEAAVAELEAKNVHRIIVLSHLGYDVDQDLARKVRGVDVIVGGHTHTILGKHAGSEGPYPTLVVRDDGSRALVVQAGLQARFAGSLTVVFDEAGNVTSYVGELRELTADMPRQADVQALIAEQSRRVTAHLHETLARTEDMGDDGLDYCRRSECPSGLITADAYLDFGKAYGASVALVNAGSIRSALPVGEVSYADAQNIHPFGNRLGVIELSGRTLRSALEHGLSADQAVGPRLLQPAGLRYSVHGARPAGTRLGEVQIRQADGTWRELRDEEPVRVVLCDYLLKGGDAFSMLAGVGQRTQLLSSEQGLTDLEVFTDYIRTHRRGKKLLLPPPEFGRITRLPDDK